MVKNRVILGVDPGTQIIGWGVIEIRGGKPCYRAMGIIHLKSEKDHFARLGKIYNEIASLIKKFDPTEFAIESPFYGKNVQAMLKLGRAQGIAIASALASGIEVCEYAPRKIKLAVTGKGAASKEQVSMVVRAILKVDEAPPSLDATDGLAIALCHFLSGDSSAIFGGQIAANKRSNSKGPKNWSDFLRENPNRIK